MAVVEYESIIWDHKNTSSRNRRDVSAKGSKGLGFMLQRFVSSGSQLVSYQTEGLHLKLPSPIHIYLKSYQIHVPVSINILIQVVAIMSLSDLLSGGMPIDSQLASDLLTGRTE